MKRPKHPSEGRESIARDVQHKVILIRIQGDEKQEKKPNKRYKEKESDKLEETKKMGEM